MSRTEWSARLALRLGHEALDYMLPIGERNHLMLASFGATLLFALLNLR